MCWISAQLYCVQTHWAKLIRTCASCTSVKLSRCLGSALLVRLCAWESFGLAAAGRNMDRRHRCELLIQILTVATAHTRGVAPQGVVGFAAAGVNQTPGSAIRWARESADCCCSIKNKRRFYARFLMRLLEEFLKKPFLHWDWVKGIRCLTLALMDCSASSTQDCQLWKNTQTSLFGSEFCKGRDGGIIFWTLLLMEKKQLFFHFFPIFIFGII